MNKTIVGLIIFIYCNSSVFCETRDTSKIELDLDYYMNMHKKNPDAVEYILQLAKYYKEKKMFNKSLNWFKKAELLQPQNADVLLQIGLLLSWTDNYDEAINYFNRVLAIAPQYDDAKLAKARIWSWKGDYNRAISYFKKYLKINPGNLETEKALARTYRWAGRYKEGIAIQKKILERDKNNLSAVMEIALLYEMQGKYKQAIKWYEKALALGGDKPQINAHLGLLYSRSNQIDEAITTLQKALTVQDNDIESLITLGRVYSWKLRIAESIKLYKDALRIDPYNQEAYIGLGRTYFYDGNWSESRRQFKKVLEINPLNQEASAELRKLENLKKPRFETRVDYFKLKNYEPSLSGFSEKTIRHEYSQSVDMSFSSIFSGGFRYKRIIEKELTSTDKNYGLTGEEYSLLLYRQFDKKIKLTGRLIAGFYRDNGSEVYILRDKETGLSGFILTRYDWNKWMFTANYGSELVYPIYRGNDLKIKYLENTGLSARHDTTEDISFFLSVFYKDYYSIYSRKDYTSGVEYILPFLKQCELSYYFRHLTNSPEDIHTLRTNYKNRFRKIDYSVTYALETDSLYDTNTHSLNVFSYYNITDMVRVYADISYDVERRGDRDESFHSKVYTAYQF